MRARRKIEEQVFGKRKADRLVDEAAIAGLPRLKKEIDEKVAEKTKETEAVMEKAKAEK